MDQQEIINWLLGALGAVFGFLLRSVWQSVKDLQAADKELADKVGSIEILVAGAYVRKDEFARSIDAVFAKLDKMADKIDRIDDKLDQKADK